MVRALRGRATSLPISAVTGVRVCCVVGLEHSVTRLIVGCFRRDGVVLPSFFRIPITPSLTIVLGEPICVCLVDEN